MRTPTGAWAWLALPLLAGCPQAVTTLSDELSRDAGARSDAAGGDAAVGDAAVPDMGPPFDGGTGDCGATGCPPGTVCDDDSGRCLQRCGGDDECAPPRTVCQAGACRPGCTEPGGLRCEVCDPMTGRCVAGSPCPGDEMVDLGAYRIDAYEASRFDATADDVGDDDSSGACSRPGILPWRDLTWFEARDACAAVGKRLCTTDEWEDACDGTVGAGGRTYPYGDDYGPDTCNGRDRQGSVQPTGSLSFCATPEGIFDLSGNVSEWLGTEVVAGAYGVKGGAAAGSDNFLQCAPLDRYEPTRAFGLRGFRCCRDSN